ncbi:alpha-amylase/alpha-mannosidase [Marinitoga piezophila KA3]|uniref:Alpha-amylase/alpha-mannosidase n=1 Tax=Marinitoga piezophila (strain DSM 14283 / JCM 11233 / KA3) TaxID=443254 RepID=H2J470_MARPK|nr:MULTISPECIES: glucodextranase DOMON-like domain-containing protein [Marinitoga]AEX85885.1 alpha-amylase/alpha-mannosidase [Marinitoga piezophila KA3]
MKKTHLRHGYVLMILLSILSLVLFVGCGAQQQSTTTAITPPETSVESNAKVESNTSEVTLTFKVALPSNTPADEKVYIVGSFNDWNPGDDAYVLNRDGNTGTVTITVNKDTEIEYKYTRGNWGTVEKDKDGNEIANRKVIADSNKIVEDTVESWADIPAEIKTAAQPGEKAVVKFEVTLPPNTPENDVIYIVGNFNNWDPGKLAMKRNGLKATFELETEVGKRLEYKYTRGNWDTVEKDENGEEIPNRVVIVKDIEQEQKDSVASWRDLPPQATASDNSNAPEINEINEKSVEAFLNSVPKGNEDKEPLKVVIIWHHHQPAYKIPGEKDAEMPWVRAHAVNDYPYMADLVDKYLTSGRVTFNITPVLLMQLMDYVKNGGEDKYLKLSLKDNLTDEEKDFVKWHFFDINPQFVDTHPRYVELREKRDKNEEFNSQDWLDLKVMWNLYWINIEYINADKRLKALMEKDRNYTKDDLDYVISKHYELMNSIVEKYQKLWEEGKIELTTTPYYHPILPLLIDMGWPEDAKAQIEKGLSYFEEIFGKRPEGMWPSEQAVSTPLVPMFADNNVKWIVTDKQILQKAGINTGDPHQLYKPYKVTVDGKSVVVFFRDTDLSDRIGFKYSNMSKEGAVKDFLSALHNIQKMNDEGDMVVTVALDGENAWEHYPNNGNDFRKLFYEALSNDPYIELVTPEEYIENYGVNNELNQLPKGSWVGGSLDTWYGEKEENEAWDRLAKAREVLMSNKDNISKEDFKKALNTLYAAEGSDWFWWYGSDQDAGPNEVLFDMQFKKLLIQIYKLAGVPEEKIPGYLYIANKRPSTASKGNIGKVEIVLDGEISDNEMEKSAYYLDDDSGVMYKEGDLISGIYVGRDNANLYVAVELKKSIEDLKGKPYKLEIYTDKPGAQKLNTRTAYSGVGEKVTDLGFALAKRFSFNLQKYPKLSDLYYYNASGTERWMIGGKKKDLIAVKGNIVEFKIPYDLIGVKSGDEFNLAVVMAYTEKGNSKDVDFAPNSGPVHVMIPKEIGGKLVKEFKDPIGDEDGPGGYTYPKDGAFEPFKGLWDIEWVKVYDADDSIVFKFKFGEITNPWGAPKGFSHQLINIYLDTKDGGKVSTYKEGARVQFDTAHPWDYFIKIAGWPSYGQLLADSNDQEFPEGVQVECDPGEKIISVIVMKKYLKMDSNKIFAYFMVGSQDGYGADHFRAVTPESGQWTLGGYPSDAGDFGPFVLDIIVPEGYDQHKVLSSYDASKEKYATLIPVEIDF